jgi:sugar lactone lactonase YvrE
MLNPGDILVSNFNNSQNLQGTGTTIVRVTPAGATSLFYQGKAGLGLTAALVAVKHGLVFVGNMPTTDGTSNTVQAGSILVIDRNGQLDGTLTDPTLINGPWGMAIHEDGNQAQMFVSNVLSGTVVRFDLSFYENSDAVQIRQKTVIASGYAHRGDPAALELGPSGLAYDAENDILYVASSLDDAVYAIDNAGSLMSAGGTGKMIYQDNTHLHGPLDLVLAPNGHLIVANSDGMNADPNQPSEIVEFTTAGQFVAQFSVDPNNGGAFGVNLVNVGGAVRFAAVDDNKNDLNMWTVAIQ